MYGPGPRAEAGALIAAQRLVESFRSQNEHTNCIDITGIDKSTSAVRMFTYFFIKGGTIDCMRRDVKFAPAAFAGIDTVYSEARIDAPAAPASCSALLAYRMGAGDLHAVMAAGLAGGIGLSGGACGALGAAIWIIGMNSIQAGAEKIDFINPEATAAICRFLKSTGYEFECSKIVGRTFTDVADHAAYIHAGGCSKIIDTLAAPDRAS